MSKIFYPRFQSWTAPRSTIACAVSLSAEANQNANQASPVEAMKARLDTKSPSG